MRDPGRSAAHECCLEELDEAHWLRYTQEALDTLNALPHAVSIVGEGNVEVEVDLREIKSFYRTHADSPIRGGSSSAPLAAADAADADEPMQTNEATACYFHVHPELVVRIDGKGAEISGNARAPPCGALRAAPSPW